MHFLRRLLPLVTVAAAIGILYLYNLGAAGVLGPDEPRYAAIGLTMARTHQFVTPVLWGHPWFEKPPLLYWMTAAAVPLGLSPEWTARLPVALLSLAFLAAMFELLRREFGGQAAGAATAMLATCAGWLAYSNLALTDLPLAVFFSLAVLLALPLLRPAPDTSHIALRFAAIGVALGIAVLAKGLVPLALAIPGLWFLRRYRRMWPLAFATLAVIALPWYVAVYVQNGWQFIEEFFIRHHFERLYSASLQHVQPWYYYAPVLLAALFPWTPALILLANRGSASDPRRQFLAATSVFGVALFSVSLNKLPGYILPILPCLFAYIGAQFEHRAVGRTSRGILSACAVLIATIPIVAVILPDSLSSGHYAFTAAHLNRTAAFYIAAPVAAVFLGRRPWIGPLLVLCVVASGMYLKTFADPVLNEDVSARGLWSEIRDKAGSLCDAGTNREWLYGINFYNGAALPGCDAGQFRFELHSTGHKRPVVLPR